MATLRPGGSFATDSLPILRFVAGALFYHQKHLNVIRGLRGSLLGMFKSLIQIVDARDQYTAGHSERVAQIARRIGGALELPTTEVNDLYLAGLLHDVGTIGVPDEVLHCQSKLTGDQMAQMRRHVLIGDELLAGSKHVDRLRPGVRNHHERWDGKGYPDGLKGDEIPLLARVVAVADACDALMSARRYRPPLSPPQIEAVLNRFSGTQWDPQVVTAFLKCSKEVFPPIYPKGIGESAYHALSDVVSEQVERSTIFHPALDERLLNGASSQ
jgi:HD-GYP domain-containing protein (c-di-GMP phosphodiesterase class II)